MTKSITEELDELKKKLSQKRDHGNAHHGGNKYLRGASPQKTVQLTKGTRRI